MRQEYALVGYRDPVTSLEIALILAGVPLAIMVLLGLLTLRPNFARPRRYRPGQEWNYPPVLWTANPEMLRESNFQRAGAARGGARGHW
ncbi:MAG: aa3-type cytochrome oxidase subunit CtaJ [Pseudonocardiaceae bacterium]